MRRRGRGRGVDIIFLSWKVVVGECFQPKENCGYKSREKTIGFLVSRDRNAILMNVCPLKWAPIHTNAQHVM